MERRGVPLLVALLAVLAVGQGPRLLVQQAAPAGDNQAKEEEKSQRKAPAAEKKPESSADQTLARARAEPLRLVRELLDLPPAEIPGSEADLTWIAGTLGRDHLASVVALVPDPVDSNVAANFDQALEAIQEGCADAGFLLDRLWLPWTDEWAKQNVYRSVPGVLLLRGAEPGPALLTVLLVGETPKEGVHKEAFRAALSIAAQLQPDGEPVRLLGPTFSGSVDSLQVALARVERDSGAVPSLRVVTGSATAPDELFAFLGSDFTRTVVPDERLQTETFGFLTRQMGWRADKMALLTESDTLYGSTASTRVPGGPVTVLFPSGLGSVRSAWEKSEKQRAAEAEKQNPLKVPRTSLELSLVDESKPVDIAPQFSGLTAASKDLVLSNLLDSLWRSGIRYVGILSTDVRDSLYLAQRVRTFAPDMVLFTIDNNLLYAHPQYLNELDGALVLSSFPLVTESEARPRWFPASAPPRYRRQFASAFQEGIFLATAKLLGKQVPPPRSWIAAIGNGALWPLAGFPARTPRLDETTGRGDLQLLLLAAILCLLALWLRQVYPPAKLLAGTHLTPAERATPRRLLAFGSAVLGLLGGVLVVVGTVPNWSGRFGVRSTNGGELAYEILYLAALTAGYLFLVCNAAWLTGTARRSAGSGATPGRLLVWSAAGLLLLLPLGWLLHRLWMPGGAELFFLRARRLASGLSPLVSLGLLGGALYSWVLMELKRRRLVARHLIEWPLRERLEPPLVGTREIAGPVWALLRRTFPTWRRSAPERVAIPLAAEGRWFWSALALVLTPPGLMLLGVVQPICEPRGYGMIFLALCLFAFALAAVSFHQFFALWLNLDRLLRRLDHTRLVPAFRNIHDAVAWSPMRGFGWSLPGFKMVALSAERLQHLPVSDSMKKKVLQELGAMFAADLADDLNAETQARTRLNNLFAEACHTLASRSDEPAVEEYFALRIVAFLRPVVAHMRNCLAASLLALLFLLYAVRSYAFEPKWFISLGIWVAMGVGVAVTLWIFVQMDRNVTLSAIGKTNPGEVSFDRHFYLNLLTYGVLPVAGILITQFPEIGRFLTGWLNPLLRLAAV